MKRTIYQINGQEVEISHETDQLWVNGKPIAAELIKRDQAQVKMLVNDQIHVYSILDKSKIGMRLKQQDQEFQIAWPTSDSAASKPQKTDAVPAVSTKVVKAPLPGVILKIVAAPGQSIKKNDVVLVIESMKMQIDVRSSIEGTLKSMQVKVGDQVEANTVVAELD